MDVLVEAADLDAERTFVRSSHVGRDNAGRNFATGIGPPDTDRATDRTRSN
jgi:hypothetical protein